MFQIPLNTGFTRYSWSLPEGKIFVTKHDDGRFEYFGKLTVPKNYQTIQFNHGFPAHDVAGVASNIYVNSPYIVVSMTCNDTITRIDYFNLDGSIITANTNINIHVMGFWK